MAKPIEVGVDALAQFQLKDIITHGTNLYRELTVAYMRHSDLTERAGIQVCHHMYTALSLCRS